MSNAKIRLLQAAISNFVTTQPPPRLPLVNDEVSAWYAKHGIVFHYGFYDDGRAYGFNAEGAKAIGGLADVLLAEQPRWRAGTRWLTLATAIAKSIQVTPSLQATQTDLGRLEDAITKWFLEQTIDRTFLIPCAILPGPATAFSIGAVHFLSLRDLAVRQGMTAQQLLDHPDYHGLIQTMHGRSASWLAEVEVRGLDESVGSERANLAVDVALVAIQMSLPLFHSREIARITGRTMPPFIGTIYTTRRHVHSGLHWRDPGLGVSVAAFDQLLSTNHSLVVSIGRRVSGYLYGAQVLPKLEQAWCDGAFWLHEGLAEPLSTVAVAKLETAVEVLLSAESTKKSSLRFRAAFESFYGLKPDDPIARNNPQTVNRLIASIVGARSRVLHGTASTLSPDISRGEQDSRLVIEMLAMDLIRRFTLALDTYAQIPTAIDDTETFLAWINQKRLTNPQQTT